MASPVRHLQQLTIGQELPSSLSRWQVGMDCHLLADPGQPLDPSLIALTRFGFLAVQLKMRVQLRLYTAIPYSHKVGSYRCLETATDSYGSLRASLHLLRGRISWESISGVRS